MVYVIVTHPSDVAVAGGYSRGFVQDGRRGHETVHQDTRSVDRERGWPGGGRRRDAQPGGLPDSRCSRYIWRYFCMFVTLPWKGGARLYVQFSLCLGCAGRPADLKKEKPARTCCMFFFFHFPSVLCRLLLWRPPPMSSPSSSSLSPPRHRDVTPTTRSAFHSAAINSHVCPRGMLC